MPTAEFSAYTKDEDMQSTSPPDEIVAEMMRARRRSSSWKKLTLNGDPSLEAGFRNLVSVTRCCPLLYCGASGIHWEHTRSVVHIEA